MNLKDICDVFWLALNGLVVDMDHYVTHSVNPRKPFSKTGTILAEPSVFPWCDRGVKRISKNYGGWYKIMAVEFQPSDDLYREMESVGFLKADFDKSRSYVASPLNYVSRGHTDHT